MPAATSLREGARASPGSSRRRLAFALFLPRRQPRRPSRASRGSSAGQTLSENDAAAPQSLGAFLLEGIAGSEGTRRFGCQSTHALALKSWMASRTVCCPQPRFSAICGTSFPFEEARSICERRRVKASLERSPAWRVSRSFSESERTKIGVFMAKSILKMH